MPRSETATIEIDGVLDEPEWQRAARLTGFSLYSPIDGRPAERETEVRIFYSAAAIFFGVGSHNLADISFFSTGMELELGDPFTFSADLDVDVDATTVEVIFGFRVDF